MNTPTPLTRNLPLRVRNEMNSSITSTPSKRRSLINENNVTAVDNFDDDQERSRRRSLANTRGRLSSIQQSPLQENVSEKDIVTHFDNCTKLLLGNKITSKNAWSLKVIDYMRTIVKKFKNPLQMGSTGLDVATKIYTVRVDDVHSNCFQFASHMCTNENKENVNTDNTDGDAEEDENGRPREKRRKTCAENKKRTVAENVNSLLADVVKVDKLCCQIQPDSQLSAIENLCTNRIPVNVGCSKLMLMSKEIFWPSDDLRNAVSNQSDEKFSLELGNFGRYKICEAFANFAVDEWDPNQTDKTNLEQSEILNDVLVYDKQGIPVAQLDASLNVENFENGDNDIFDNDVNMDENEFHGTVVPNEPQMITEFGPDHRTVTTEYVYRSTVNTESGKVIENMWAGPSHWKLKCIKQSESKYLGKQLQKELSKKRGKKSEIIEPIDFYNFTRPDNIFAPLKTKRKPPTIDDLNRFLPLCTTSYDETIKHFSRLSTKPGIFVIKQTEIKEGTDCDGNRNDAENYLQHSNSDDIMDNDDVHEDDCEDLGNAVHNVSHEMDFINNLAEAPNLASKTFVPYSLQAKRMDMKKLKKAVWNCFRDEEDNDNLSEETPVKIAPIKFSQIYGKLLTSLSNNMKKELSCQLAFSALLHLANEHNLILTSQPDLKDITIIN